jgi:hypothetical protein
MEAGFLTVRRMRPHCISVGKCPKEAAVGLEFTAYNKGRHRKIGFKQSLTTVQYINIGGTGVK